MSIDVVIPYSAKDNYTIESCLNSLVHVRDRGNVYILADHNPQCRSNINYKWIDEHIFPFKKNDIIRINSAIPASRAGWYFQQLLKLYSFIIPNISDKFLVLDSDVIFLRDVNFIDQGKLLYNYSSEFTPDYFECMNILNPFFERSVNKSGICHHMVFEKEILAEIFNLIKRGGEEVYETIIRSVKNWHHGFSEYELYFHYIFKKYPNNYIIRYLEYADVDDYKNIDKANYHYIANHEWRRHN
jgi:hypothetical protein